MMITVTVTQLWRRYTDNGVPFAKASLAVSGLTAGAANTIPHTLPAAPASLGYRPGANGGWGETQAPDATNIYVTVAAGGATAGIIEVEYGLL